MAGGVDCLIFSKDRPAQLDLLLRSQARHAAALYRSLTVLYTWSARVFAQGYDRCVDLHPAVSWRVERDFETQTRLWLGEAVSDYVSFLVDDDLFYRPSPARVERVPLSLRGGDYDYPFSLDGNVYRRRDIAGLLAGLRFSSPTVLEHAGHQHRDRLPFTEVHACEPPCLVGVPLNRVALDSRMPQMGVHEYDLNERFLAGDRLALVETDEPLGAHACLLPLWESRVSV